MKPYLRNIQRVLHCEPTHLVSATGQQLQILGSIEIDARLNGYTLTHKFFVVRHLHHSTVIGMDMLHAFDAQINTRDHILTLLDGLIVIPLIPDQSSMPVLQLVRETKIPPRCEAILPVYCRSHYNVGPSVTEAWPGLNDKLIGVAK
jgi:hypothetical protein